MNSKIEVLRDGEAALSFEGHCLARVTSRTPVKRRWTELAMYLTLGGKYVVETVARTTHTGETDWHNASVYATGTEILAGLRDKRRGGAYSGLAIALLNTAANQDDHIAQVLDEVENRNEEID